MIELPTERKITRLVVLIEGIKRAEDMYFISQIIKCNRHLERVIGIETSNEMEVIETILLLNEFDNISNIKSIEEKTKQIIFQYRTSYIKWLEIKLQEIKNEK